jgi:serine/threonine protein kinase
MSDPQIQEERIFQEALKLSSEAERIAFLARTCAGDIQLSERLNLLLEGHFKVSCFLPEAPPNKPSTFEEETASAIGRYVLREKIGEGGCGAVYVAEQEEPVRRRVAIKVIKLGMDTRAVVARFEAERQALAMMDHPNIAKVFDGGITANGRPYFVMELVRGIRITDYCAEARLTTRQRLELFVQICQAVQHAHQKGIIHRDLKPSNVLVTLHDGQPVTKVIDFGIAKATEGRLTDKTVYTDLHQFIGTPAYMSPEQAEFSGLDIDTRSDIYSLGVLLYELLTDKTPFDATELQKGGLDEMLRTIREKEPIRPSTKLNTLRIEELTTTAKRRKTETPKLIHQLRGDLDWIVMKCLDKDRNRRYESANTLAGDIKNHLNDEPVSARPPSTAYRFRKLVRRHRAASIAVAVVTLAIFLGVIVSTWALFRERIARRQSNDRLTAALTFVDDVFEKVAPTFSNLAGAADAQEQLGQAGLRFLQRLQASAGDDPALRLSLARVFVKMSAAQNPGDANTVGNYEAGLQQAQQAIDLLAADSLPISEGEKLQLICWAKFNVVQCLYALGRIEDGVRITDEVGTWYKKLEDVPKFARYARRMRQAIRNNAGNYLTLAGRPADALQQFLMPVISSDWAESIKGNYANLESWELETLMNANAYSASAHLFLKSPSAMLPFAEESVRHADVLVQRFPRHALYPCEWVYCHAHLGYALIRTGEIERGFVALNKSREEIEKMAGKDKLNDQFQDHLAVVAAIQAMSFATWSAEASVRLPVRRERLNQATKHLAEAEQFSSNRKRKDQELYLKAARAEVTAALASQAAAVEGP